MSVPLAKPAERVRRAFLNALEEQGLRTDRITGTQLYVLNGRLEGLLYLKIRSAGKAFFGLRKDFLLSLMGVTGTIFSAEERDYLVWSLSHQVGAEPPIPDGWNRRSSSIFRRVRMIAKGGKLWACVLLLGRDDNWVCDGWLLREGHVVDGMKRWSYSQGEYKINENNLRRLPKFFGLASMAGATLKALGR